MSALIPFFILILLIHGGVYVTSDNQNRKFKFVLGLSIACLALPIAIYGYFWAEEYPLRTLLSGSLLLFSALSLLVYLPSWWRK